MSESLQSQIIQAELTKSQERRLFKYTNKQEVEIRSESRWLSFDKFMKRPEIAVHYPAQRMSVMKLRFNRLLITLESLESKEHELLLQLKSKYNESPIDNNTIKDLNSELEELEKNINLEKENTKVNIADFFAKFEERANLLNQQNNSELLVNPDSQPSNPSNRKLRIQEETPDIETEQEQQIDTFADYIINSSPELSKVQVKIDKERLRLATLKMYQDPSIIECYIQQFEEIKVTLMQLLASLSDKINIIDADNPNIPRNPQIVSDLSKNFIFPTKVKNCLNTVTIESGFSDAISLILILSLLKNVGLISEFQNRYSSITDFDNSMSEIISQVYNAPGGSSIIAKDAIDDYSKTFINQLRSSIISENTQISGDHLYQPQHKIVSLLNSFNGTIKFVKGIWLENKDLRLPYLSEYQKLKCIPSQDLQISSNGITTSPGYLNNSINDDLNKLLKAKSELEDGILSHKNINENLKKIINLDIIEIKYNPYLTRYVVYKNLSDENHLDLIPDSENFKDIEGKLRIQVNDFVQELDRVVPNNKLRNKNSCLTNLLLTERHGRILDTTLSDIIGFDIPEKNIAGMKNTKYNTLIDLKKNILPTIQSYRKIINTQEDSERAVLEELEKLINQIHRGGDSKQTEEFEKFMGNGDGSKSVDDFYVGLYTFIQKHPSK